MVHVRVLRLAYPTKGVVEERRCRITKSARDLDAERDEDGVVVPKHLVELRDVLYGSAHSKLSIFSSLLCAHEAIDPDPECPHDLRTGLRSSWSCLVHALWLQQVRMFAGYPDIISTCYPYIKGFIRDSPYIMF